MMQLLFSFSHSDSTHHAQNPCFNRMGIQSNFTNKYTCSNNRYYDGLMTDIIHRFKRLHLQYLNQADSISTCYLCLFLYNYVYVISGCNVKPHKPIHLLAYINKVRIWIFQNKIWREVTLLSKWNWIHVWVWWRTRPSWPMKSWSGCQGKREL